MEFLHKHSDTVWNDSIDQRTGAATFQGESLMICWTRNTRNIIWNMKKHFILWFVVTWCFSSFCCDIYFCLSSFAFVVQKNSNSNNNNSIKSRKIINLCWNIWNSVITSFSLRFLYIYILHFLSKCCCWSWCSLYLLTFLTLPYCWYWCRRIWSAVIVRLLLRILILTSSMEKKWNKLQQYI